LLIANATTRSTDLSGDPRATPSHLRKLMPRSTLLAPGLGSQGGDASALASPTTKTGSVLVSTSRGIARVEDRGMPIETYKALVRNRIAAYAAAVKPQVSQTQ
jgi:orotidine-5'-phosphate decarboxylase